MPPLIEICFLTRTNRFIEEDIARIVWPAIWDGISFRIKRANQIESVVYRLAVCRFIGVAKLVVVLRNGLILSVAPWQLMPAPYVLQLLTWDYLYCLIRHFPSCLATGAAVLETCACAG